MPILSKGNNSIFKGSLWFKKTKDCSNLSELGKNLPYCLQIISNLKLSAKEKILRFSLSILLFCKFFTNSHLSNKKKLQIFTKLNKHKKYLNIWIFFQNNPEKLELNNVN